MTRPSRGFTLPELVIVIAIIGVVGGIFAVLLRGPIEARADLARRAALVDQAEQALHRVAYDLHNALGNSIRVGGGGTALEMINVAAAGRYRLNQDDTGIDDHDTNAHRLAINANDASFDLLGRWSVTGATGRLVVSNFGVNNANVYQNTRVITPTTTTVTVSNDTTDSEIDRVTLSANMIFRYASTNRRIYMVDTAIGYQCSGGDLTRHAYTGWNTSAPPANFGAGSLVVDGVTACDFNYDAGDTRRGPLVRLALELTRDGESVTLMHQVAIGNPP
jgi:MSHA biogenesis protein MshO